VGREPERSEAVFDGALFRVEVEHWPGDVRREVARHLGGCAAVVLLDDGNVVLIRQFREVVRRPLLEVPAGVYDESGETPEQTMRREVEEETGYTVTSVEPLGRILTSPGYTDEWIDLFLVRAEPDGEAEEGIETVVVPLDTAVEMVHRGEIEDAKSALGLLLAAHRSSD
jgi:ADP-ribose pyrophosphatase